MSILLHRPFGDWSLDQDEHGISFSKHGTRHFSITDTGALKLHSLGNGSTLPLKAASDGIVSSSQLASADLPNDVIQWDHMSDDSVGSAQILDTSILENHIAQNSINQQMLKSSIVGSDELIDGSCTASKLAVDSVGVAAIQTDACTSDAIRAGNVQNVHIEDGAITLSKMGSNSVDRDVLMSNSVGSAELRTGAIDEEHLSAACVSGSKCAATMAFTTQISCPLIIPTISYKEVIPPSRFLANDDANAHAFILRGLTGGTVHASSKFGITVSHDDQELYYQFAPPYQYKLTKVYVAVQQIDDATGRGHSCVLRKTYIGSTSFSDIETFNTNTEHTCSTTIQTTNVNEDSIYYTLDCGVNNEDVLTGAWLQFESVL